MFKIRKVPRKGRAMVATKCIKAGELIERAPVGAFPACERRTINKTAIFEHYFVKPDEYQRSRQVPGYVVFGFTSLCNHADKPNSIVEWVEDETGVWTLLRALRTIKPSEEITVCYTNLDEYEEAGEFV